MNVRSVVSALLFASLALPAMPASATDYELDPVHTQIFACASHLRFSTPCAHLKIKSGFFRFDNGDWTTAKVGATVDTTSLDLGDAAWNAKMRSWEFLETSKYPEAHFVSLSAEKTGDRTGIIHGMLTLRGVTRKLDLAVTFNRAGLDPYNLRYTAGFSATATIERSQFGMTKYLPDIGDTVRIRIGAEGLRSKPAPVQTAPAKLER